MMKQIGLLLLILSIVNRCFCLQIKDFLDSKDNLQSSDRDVFHPTVIYRSRSKRSAAGSHERVPVEVRFSALGRKFHFQLEPAHQPFSKMSHVLIRSGNESRILGALSDGVEDCLLKGKSGSREKVALNFCGGIRGVLTLENDYYIINPLNDHNQGRVKRDSHASIPHVIFRKPKRQSSCPHSDPNRKPKSYFPRPQPRRHDDLYQYLQVEPDKYFPNQFYNYNIKSRAYFPSSDGNKIDAWAHRASGKINEKFFIEMAIFVDRELFKIMQENFPVDTEEHIIQVVLAMINAVQLLYNDETLGVDVQFLIKRLEILQTDPPELERSYNIDQYLASFCKWQAGENLASDSDPLHWDHAVILTGLDVHVLDSNHKISSQVVGLAPVSGMCNPATSCTVNEGRHFESVYVMAHEIGHNLGMRHDGEEDGNSCSAGSYIMSPTLGSGKISWSHCSRAYLHRFLASDQADCLKDRGPSEVSHYSSGSDRMLPGERFPADIQCRLRYGPDSYHSKQQSPTALCRDLHCRREHYTWTSHPALEGTSCGQGRWCRGGECVVTRGDTRLDTTADTGLTHGGWSSWSETSCRSSCLYSVTGSLARGSTGLVLASRSCTNPAPSKGGRQCQGKNFKFTTCNSIRQCMTVRKQSVADHSRSSCEAASRRDSSLLPYGDLTSLLTGPSPAGACQVSCYTSASVRVNRGWSFPDGTVCRVTDRSQSSSSFCIQGVCQEFSCDDDATYQLHSDLCKEKQSALVYDHGVTHAHDTDQGDNDGWTPWTPVSKCSFSCLVPARGLQMMTRVCQARVCEGVDSTLGLCDDKATSCRKLITPFQFASQTCDNFRIGKLSGIGMQLTSTTLDPDRACKVACQDRDYSYRFYMVSGEKGWFPYGTDCSRGKGRRDAAYCVKGRCLEFGSDGTPLYVPFTPSDNDSHHLFKRSLIFATTGRGRVAGSIDQEYLEQIVQDFNKTINGDQQEATSQSSIIFDQPIDIPQPELDEITTNKVFHSSNSSDIRMWENYDVSDEFLADLDVVYKETSSNAVKTTALLVWATFVFCLFMTHIY